VLEQEEYVPKYNPKKIVKWNRKNKGEGKRVIKKAPPPEAFIPNKSSEGDLSCDMDGLVEMTMEILTLLTLLVQFYVETYSVIMPKNIAKSA